MSKDLQFCLEFHPKGYLFQFVFDQHESTKHVKLDGFQDGLWVREHLEIQQPRNF